MLCVAVSRIGLARRGELDLRLRLLVSAFVVLKGDLHCNQVTLPRRGILHNPESNILVAECLVASFGARRLPNIIIVIGIINIIPRLGLVIVGVFGVIHRIQLFIVQVIEVCGRLLLVEVGGIGILPWVLVRSVVLHCIHKLCWPCPCEDGQKEGRRKSMALVLHWEYAGVLGPEMGEEE